MHLLHSGHMARIAARGLNIKDNFKSVDWIKVNQMKRCSQKAFSLCPDRDFCGCVDDATFAEGSECDAFNKQSLKIMSNGDRIRSMDDEELTEFLNAWAQKPFAWKQEPGTTGWWIKEPWK